MAYEPTRDCVECGEELERTDTVVRVDLLGYFCPECAEQADNRYRTDGPAELGWLLV